MECICSWTFKIMSISSWSSVLLANIFLHLVLKSLYNDSLVRKQERGGGNPKAINNGKQIIKLA